MSATIRSLALPYILAASSVPTAAADKLATAFAQPPAATKPRCYWYWMPVAMHSGSCVTVTDQGGRSTLHSSPSEMLRRFL